ncbi:MAG TPA: diguanylate cyclase [Aromatoleum sp.]|uniref:diguanylate cyclase domain-containing protein n=1 Tax=Aromatoleum sp. TaxID=2307007 RepID=UPI002B499915|nr:diguanylate cyclase [Aromatoleum sp.]HJV25950.1 diguanylate cyclase [Aromatoleum sp.]
MEYAAVESRHSAQVFAEQVGLLYKNAPLAYSVTLVNGAILALVQISHVALIPLLGWYCALVSATALRALIVACRARARSDPGTAPRWNAAYVVGTAIAGSVWGAASFVMVPSPSVAHEVFVAFVLAGMSAGSITVLAFRMEACLAFLFPTLLPLVVHYLMLGTTLHMAMALMTAIFLIAMLVSALNFNRSVRASLTLRFDKRDLEDEIKRRDQAEQALLLEKDRLQAVLGSIGEGVALIDARGCIEYLNPVAEKICGWPSYRALGRPASAVFESFDRHLHERTTTAMEDTVHAARQITKQTVMYLNGGDKRIIEELATPLYGRHRRVVGAVSILRDVTESLLEAEQLAYAADHDALTGLPNRGLLQNRLEQAIARAQRRQERFALLFLDLDRFKEINDTMGHAAGDALLVEVARRLSDTVREEDTIARLGGDEFVVIVEGPAQEHHVRALVNKIHRILCEPYRLGSEIATVSVSIGISLFPEDGHDPEALLGHADARMYCAKNG